MAPFHSISSPTRYQWNLRLCSDLRTLTSNDAFNFEGWAVALQMWVEFFLVV